MGGILVVRLGAMGDILHALPAVASLRSSFPDQTISWLVAPRWMPLLQGNPAIDHLVPFERRTISQLRATMRRIRDIKPEIAFDFQGLIQSSVAGRLARPKYFWGFSRDIAREPLASFFYTGKIHSKAIHRVERNLALIKAAGATVLTAEAWLPQGEVDGALPDEPFILASPFAGWTGKEWPLENYSLLAETLRRENLALVLNVPGARAEELTALSNVHIHTSSISGLIYATRKATAVIGLDSGPLHLAAALGKPGVAIFGPTDPAATGPFGESLTVLRAPGFESTYKRSREIHRSMQAITVEQVRTAILQSIQDSRHEVRGAQPVEVGKRS